MRASEELIVTDREPLDRDVRVDSDRVYDRLVAAGVIEPSPVKQRTRPSARVATTGSVSELVADQRR